MLAKYADLINAPAAGNAPRRAVNVVATGNRPAELIVADSNRLVGIDGTLRDLDSDQPANLIPLISDNWRRALQVARQRADSARGTREDPLRRPESTRPRASTAVLGNTR